MAGDQQKDGAPIPPSILAALLLALGAFLVSQFPTTTSRPATQEKVPPTMSGIQDVDARLWQDPFDAVARHRDDRAKNRDRAGDPKKRCEVGVEKYRHAYGNVAAFVVPVFGGPYAEDAEHRRRTRYAVLSAIGVGGYRPADGVHIGYFDAAPGCDTSDGSAPRSESRMIPQRDLVPFEWFVSRSRGDAVVVLWIDESAMEGRPLATISQALRGAKLCDDDIRKVVVGPAGSDALVDLMNETADWDIAAGCARRAQFLSYAATADIRIEASSPQVVRTTRTDAALATALVEELERRRPWPERSSQQIALVSEWDTEYGRRFPETFSKALCEHSKRTQCSEAEVAETVVLRFSYLRGLDGVVPAPPSRTETAQSTGQGSKRPMDLLGGGEPPRAEGGSQFDYLRRLADRMAAMSANGYRAIGLVGSDPYDKLAVLGVLRAKFPDAVFFTTDLDARMIHGAAEARNVVVASTFGLELATTWQNDIPPFRDSYQTAAYFATRLAFGALERCQWQRALNVLLAPRLFELGRGVAVDITPAARESVESRVCPEAGDIHPRAMAFFFDLQGLKSLWRCELLVSLVAAFATLLLLYGVSFTVRSMINDIVATLRFRHGVLAAAGGTILVVGLPAIALWQFSLERDEGEPFALWSGVSMWPAELVRFAGLLVAVALLVKLYRSVALIRCELTAEFFPQYRHDATAWFPATLADERPGRWGLLRQVFAGFVACGRSDPPPDAEKLWKRYLFQSSFVAAAIRVAVVGTAFWVLGGSLLFLFGLPVSPARGIRFAVIDFVLVQLLVLLMTWLTVGVADAIRTCDRFARAVSGEHRTRWPQGIHRRYEKRLGITATPHLAPWLDVTFLARWTEGLGGIVFYPFVVILLMIVARSTIFDRWTTTAGLLMVYGLGVGVAVASPLILRGATERVRQTAVAQITEQLVALEGASSAPNRPPYATAAQLRLLRDEVATMRQGAFARLRDQPVLRAAALPVSGSGLLALVEFLFALR